MSAHVSLDVSKVGLFSHLEDQFTNSSTFVRELLQNARRAGASKVWITVDDAAGTLTVADDGCGVDKPEHLFTLGRSGFAENDDGLSSERPFGMGFCAALFTASRIRVATRGFSCDFIPKDALAFAPIAIGQGGFDGTEVRLWLTDDRIDAIRHLYRLNSERTVSSVFEHALEKEVGGFPIPVIFNGREIDRPDSMDKGFQPCKAGWIRIDFERRRGDMQRRGDFPRLYGQGLALLRLGPDTWKRKHADGEVVVHLGSQFRLRVPDREAVVQEQHSLASDLIREAIAEAWAEFLDEQARELSGDDFVRAWFGAALTYQPRLLNDKPLPISVFEVLDAPLSNNQDRFSPYLPVGADGDKKPVKLIGPGDSMLVIEEDFYGDMEDPGDVRKVWVSAIAAEHDVPLLIRGECLLDEGHWVYGLDCADDHIELVAPDKGVTTFGIYHSYTGEDIECSLVDQIVFRVLGREWSVSRFPVATDYCGAIVPKGWTDPDHLLLQYSSYCDEHEWFDEGRLFEDNRNAERAFELACGSEGALRDILASALRSVPLDVLKSKSLNLTFDERGHLSKVA